MRAAEAREVHIGKVVRNAVQFNFGKASRKIVGEIQERIARFDRRP